MIYNIPRGGGGGGYELDLPRSETLVGERVKNTDRHLSLSVRLHNGKGLWSFANTVQTAFKDFILSPTIAFHLQKTPGVQFLILQSGVFTSF